MIVVWQISKYFQLEKAADDWRSGEGIINGVLTVPSLLVAWVTDGLLFDGFSGD